MIIVISKFRQLKHLNNVFTIFVCLFIIHFYSNIDREKRRHFSCLFDVVLSISFSFFFFLEREKVRRQFFSRFIIFFSMFLFESFENLNSIFLKPAKELNVY